MPEPLCGDRGSGPADADLGDGRRASLPRRDDPNAAEGRLHGLYGNAFARADTEAIQRATMRIDPPTVTNVIAMASISGGYGRYDIDEITYVLSTAYTAFRAAVLESTRSRGPKVQL